MTTANTIDPHTDLLPEEQALLDGKTISAAPGATGAAALDDDTGLDDSALSAEALAAIAAKGEAPAAAAPAAGNAPEGNAVDDHAATAAAAPAAPTYSVDDPAKFDETRQALLDKRAEAMQGLVEGTMEPAAFAKVDAEVMAGLEQLTINRTLHEANVQAEQRRMQAALSTIMADGAAKGIDYASDPALQALFDTKMRAIATRDDMAGKTAAEIYQATHAEVLTMFGKGAAAPSPTPAPAAAAPTPAAPAPAPKPALPVTLGQMPNAAPVDIGADLTTTLMSMDNPDEAEAMVARMGPAQRQAALRATVGTQPLRRSGAHRNSPEA